MQAKTILRIAAISGTLAVMLGAFGAHGLKPHLDATEIQSWQTASFYHFVHTLVLLMLAYFGQIQKIPRFIPTIFILGVCLFSGSLYLISTKDLHSLPLAILGPITPIGGIFFILGWLSLFFESAKSTSSSGSGTSE